MTRSRPRQAECIGGVLHGSVVPVAGPERIEPVPAPGVPRVFWQQDLYRLRRWDDGVKPATYRYVFVERQ